MAYDPFDEDFFKRFFRYMKVAGFRIEIKDFGKGKPEVKVTRIGGPRAKIAPVETPKIERPEPPEKPREIKPVSKMLETNVGKIERPGEVVLTMQASGVKKKDVELRPLGNTLEVIARKPSGEAYFAAFELPPDAVSGTREVELKGDMLIISIPRRRRYRPAF